MWWSDGFFKRLDPTRPTPPPKKTHSHQITMYLDHHAKLLFLLLKVIFRVFSIKKQNCLFLVQVMSPGTSLSVPTMPKSNCVPFRTSPEKLSPDRTSSGEKTKWWHCFMWMWLLWVIWSRFFLGSYDLLSISGYTYKNWMMKCFILSKISIMVLE